jgi:cytochrome bd-type quinol oxidase subunit 2
VIHPLFITIAKQPAVFLDHADAYAELAMAEVACWRSRLQQRATLIVAAVLLALLGLGLAGVATLLAAALPLHAMPQPWLLWALPLVPLLIAALLAWRIRQLEPGSGFAILREQMAQDLATLKILDDER